MTLAGSNTALAWDRQTNSWVKRPRSTSAPRKGATSTSGGSTTIQRKSTAPTAPFSVDPFAMNRAGNTGLPGVAATAPPPVAPSGGSGISTTGVDMPFAPGPGGVAPNPNLAATQGNFVPGTSPLTGYVSQYTPADVADMNQMPSRYLYDILKQQGMDPTGSLYYMMEPLAEVMQPSFDLLNMSQPGATANSSANSQGNYMAKMWQEYMTPGGGALNQQQLMDNLLGPDPTSMAHQALYTGSPSEQINNVQRYMAMIGGLSGSPMYQQALSNLMSKAGMGFMNSRQGGQDPGNTFGQYLRTNYGQGL